MSNDEKESSKEDEQMICALTADEMVALREGLQSLSDTMPPRNVWLRIREQAQAEGLLTQPKARTHNRWYAGVGLAAAALMAAVMMPGVQTPTDGGGVIVPDAAVTNTADLSNLAVLQAYSRRLESDLRALPAERQGNFLARTRPIDEIAAAVALCAGATGGILDEE